MRHNMHVSVNIVTGNDRRYLPDLFASIHAQTHQDYTVRIFDDESIDDETLQYIEQYEPHWLAIRGKKRGGTAVGHNQLLRFIFARHIHHLDDHVVAFLQGNVFLHPEYFAQAVEVFQKQSDVAALQPKIFRAYIERGEHEGGVKTDILVTTGVDVCGGWFMNDRGKDEVDRGQYDEKKDIFGPSGFFCMIRASTLQEAMVQGEFFDEESSLRYFYDHVWRLQHVRAKTLFLPTMIAYEYGSLPPLHSQAFRRFSYGKLRQWFLRQRDIASGYLRVTSKNLPFWELIRIAPWLAKHCLLQIFDGSWLRVLAHLPVSMQKRRAILLISKIDFSRVRSYKEKYRHQKMSS